MDKPDVLADLEMKNVTTLGVNFTTMMEVIFLCEEMSEETDMSTRVDMEVMEDTGFWSSFVRSFQTLTKGIAPGTLWCGTNDIAPSYKSLGEDKSLDKCVTKTTKLCQSSSTAKVSVKHSVQIN